ncbi:hypothetical protein AOLI_G00149250 [Acnodon oligacanthus]
MLVAGGGGGKWGFTLPSSAFCFAGSVSLWSDIIVEGSGAGRCWCLSGCEAKLQNALCGHIPRHSHAEKQAEAPNAPAANSSSSRCSTP